MKRWQQEQTAVAANAQTATARLAGLTEQVTALATQRDRYATALADKNNLESEQPRLRQQMDRHKERMDQLAAETGGTCPFCGQPLTDEHRDSVVADLQTEGSEMGNRYRNNREQLAALGTEVAELEKIIQRAPQQEKDQQVQQQRLAQAEARLVEIEGALAAWNDKELPQLAALEAQQADMSALTAQQAVVDTAQAAVAGKPQLEGKRREVQTRLARAAARLAEIERQLSEWESSGKDALAAVTEQLQTEAFAAEARTELARLDAEIVTLAYDAEQHQGAREQRDVLAAAPQRHQQLQQAEAAVQPLQQSLLDLQQRLQDQEQTVAELAAQHETAVSDLEALVDNSGDLRAVEDEVFQLREDESIKQRTVGAAQQRLAVLADQRRRHDELTERKAGVAQQIQRLRLLEKACGRDGVQALLIEQALPDIEERANDLLERLTGGEMRVSFDTQRQLKSRKATVETLDIHIIDGVGERPYENFSGGEQFRVNFAIRLALSQVLAKRAGARLQTLVIDEGFGSQDPQGRQRLVEAINTIQQDFACILVITHIDELRDAFPTRIEVTKALLGSTIVVV